MATRLHSGGNVASGLVLSLLGPIQAELDGRPLGQSPGDKMHGLLAYLAVESDRRHSRDRLADLFWPNHSGDTARLNLRQLLFKLRQALGDTTRAVPFLEVTRDTIGFNKASEHWIDTTFFCQPIPCNSDECGRCTTLMDAAVALYRGPFLEQWFLSDDMEAYQEWLVARRESFHRRALSLLEQLIDCTEGEGRTAAAVTYLQRYTEIEPWDEAAHRRLMTLLAVSGKRGAAIAHYQGCERMLLQEYGCSPEPATRTLFEQIRDGRLEVKRQQAAPVRQSQGLAAERRQVTVLCCEFVFEELVDPEDMADRLLPLRAACERLLQCANAHLALTPGVHLVAFFGYPIAQEDAAKKAVRVALEVLAECRRRREEVGIAARMGVHTGVIVTGQDPQFPDLAGLVSGTAIRVRDQAQLGTLAVSGATYPLLQGGFALRHTATLTNGPLPLDVYALEPTQDVAKVPLFSAPLVGREAELECCLSRWNLARQGQGQVVALQGEAGIGKSRLARAVVERLRGRDFLLREFVCLPVYQGTALHPVTELLRSLCGHRSLDRSADNLESLHKLVEPFGLDGEAVQLLARLLSLSGEGEFSREQKDTIHELLLQFVEHKARSQPVLLLFEDLHWADPSTLELLESFLLRIASLPVLVLMTFRADFFPPWPMHPACTMLSLGPINRAASRQLVERLGQGLSLAERETVVRRADGVPLFIEEMVKVVQERDPGNAGDSEIPVTLYDLLMTRLDRLGPAKKVAQLGATLGREFTLRLLQAVTLQDAPLLRAALAQLVKAGLVYVQSDNGESLYRFKHALIQQVAYQSQPKRHREETHRRVAQALLDHYPDLAIGKPELLAQHLSEAGESERAIRYWLQAGLRASRRAENLEAIEHLDKGLRLLQGFMDSPHKRALELDLHLALGPALIEIHGYGSSKAAAIYDRALELCEDDGAHQLFPALWGLWLGGSTRAGYRSSLELAHRLLAVAERSGNPALFIPAHYALGNNYFWLGELAAAHQHLSQALLAYEQLFGEGPAPFECEEARVASHAFLGWVHGLQGRPGEALEAFAHALRLARALANPNSLAFALAFHAMHHRFYGGVNDTRCYVNELRALAEEQGIVLWQAAGEALQGWCEALSGDEGGVARTIGSLSNMEASMSSLEVTFLALLAEAQHASGQHREALATLEKAHDAARRRDDCYYLAELHRLKGECLAELGQAAAARLCFETARTVAADHTALLFEQRAQERLKRLEAEMS